MRRFLVVLLPWVAAVSLSGQTRRLDYDILMLAGKVGSFRVTMEGERLETFAKIRVAGVVSLTQRIVIDYDPVLGGIRREETRNVFNGKPETFIVERKGGELDLLWLPSGRRERRAVRENEPFYTFNAFLRPLYEDRVREGKVYHLLLDPRMLRVTKSNISATNFRLKSSDNTVNVDITWRRQADGTVLPTLIRVVRYVYLGFNWSILNLRMELSKGGR